MADVPCESDHGSVFGIHYRIFNDVGLSRHVGRQELLSPARRSVGFGQKPSGDETVVRSHLPKDYVFSQDMITEEKGKRGLHKTGRPSQTPSTAYYQTILFL